MRVAHLGAAALMAAIALAPSCASVAGLTRCESDGDCARASAATCDLTSHTCVDADAGATLDDASPPPLDAPRADAPLTGDAQARDASPPGALVWAKRIGGADEDFEDGVDVDPSGGVGVAGSTRNDLDFGAGAQKNGGGADMFAARFDKGGASTFGRLFGDSADQFGTGLALNGSGEMFVLTLFKGTVDFGAAGVAHDTDSDFDLALLRVRNDLSLATFAAFTGTGPQNSFAVAADPSAGALVAGQNGGVMILSGKTLSATEPNDAFFAHVLSSQDWALGYSAAAPGVDMSAVAYDLSGSVFVTGSFTNALDLGGGALQSAGGRDVFVAKFGAQGQYGKAVRFGNATDQRAQRVAVDKTGNVIVTGWFTGTVSFGGADLVASGGEDVFVLVLDPNLAHVRSFAFGSPANDEATGLAVDGAGEIVLSGHSFGSIDFGGGPLPNAGNADIFVAKLRADGSHLWSRSIGDGGDQRSYQGCAATSAGEVYLTGHFTGAIDVGGTQLTSAGSHDVFLAKYAP